MEGDYSKERNDQRYNESRKFYQSYYIRIKDSFQLYQYEQYSLVEVISYIGGLYSGLKLIFMTIT